MSIEWRLFFFPLLYLLSQKLFLIVQALGVIFISFFKILQEVAGLLDSHSMQQMNLMSEFESDFVYLK